MNFPIIKTIDDVYPHIKDNDNFSVNQKDDYIVIDYILNTPDLFNDPIQKECRGIIFNAFDGKILARRFHKFFNFGERYETSTYAIDVNKPHDILEKVDGSLLSPLVVYGEIRWASKAGLTFLTPQVEEFVKQHPNYKDFAEMMETLNHTPIFEWCSRQNRIVLDYPTDRLILLAIRDKISGEYYPYSTLVTLAQIYKLDIIQNFGTTKDIVLLSNTTKNIIGIEGFVVTFEDGFRVKMKCDEYLRYHKAKNDINLEKNVISILINSQSDDFRLLLSEQDRERFERFEKDFFNKLEEYVETAYNIVCIYNQTNMIKKEFALLSEGWKDRHLRNIVFKFFSHDHIDENHVKEEVVEIIKKNCNSTTNLERVRNMFGNINWYNY